MGLASVRGCAVLNTWSMDGDVFNAIMDKSFPLLLKVSKIDRLDNLI
uniref:Uncharacterized protein n=1 Tax=Rhizophora mucronata TaxID=61149 RepID=A0A2P2QYP2_RHIMU